MFLIIETEDSLLEMNLIISNTVFQAEVFK
jgi:hypothetical protein